ncbi:SigE family RNA polymerase sigma factor [Terracoccus sp. 273MFTsu3.1]|uniref:SigE family RNA polymerase sigma factor n=1 Tax=Terracoccus sp. 273MFTsu3.1 TaxID=1172188 RepID=UPI000381C8FF|nr:SigE family RNA polymerase sigma factor [Terracoccus sp. 273MFTsu3.1]
MRTRAQREAEFSDYVARRRTHLFRTAWLICGDSHLAEDLVQQTLTKLYVSWHRLREESAVDAYARRILVNTHLDEVRRPFRRSERSAPDDELDRAGRMDLAYEDLDDLGAALRALPPGQRTVVVLRHYWGLSVNETADTLGIAPGTVKSQTFEAIAQLRRTLEPTTTTGKG